MVFLTAFLSPKQSKNERDLYIIHGKANGISFTWRIQALELFSPLPKANQECNEEKQREDSNMKKFKRTATIGHILSTSWSPFYAYYMSFWSSGSQESNALNGMQIGAEMKKLWSLKTFSPSWKAISQAMKSTFSCKINLFLQNGHFQLAKFSQPMLHAAKST